MRIIFITLLVTVMCSLSIMSYADDLFDCQNKCSDEKSSKDTNCPGGYSDEDHKQCLAANTMAYNDCIQKCSPTSVTPKQTPQPEGSGAMDKK